MIRVLFFLLLSATAASAQVELVVERKPTQATLYLSIPMSLVPDVLGLSQDAPTLADVTDAITVRTPDQAVALSPNALILHPTADPLPFDAPWDASTAVQFGGVTSPAPGTPMTLYARIDAPGIDAHQALSISFPASTTPDATLEIRDFVRDQVRDRISQDLAAGAVVLLPDVHANRNGTLLTIAIGVLFVLTLAYDLFRRRRIEAREKTVTKP